jgi:hypothetical protein
MRRGVAWQKLNEPKKAKEDLLKALEVNWQHLN